VDGERIAQGLGLSDPSQGGTGSTAFGDDFLAFSFTEPGIYILQVGKGLPAGPGGLPEGVNYDLQVSIQNHGVDGFVFAPEPVQDLAANYSLD
jgi:hypothetical protein